LVTPHENTVNQPAQAIASHGPGINRTGLDVEAAG